MSKSSETRVASQESDVQTTGDVTEKAPVILLSPEAHEALRAIAERSGLPWYIVLTSVLEGVDVDAEVARLDAVTGDIQTD
jgi:hypothetical protein